MISKECCYCCNSRNDVRPANYYDGRNPVPVCKRCREALKIDVVLPHKERLLNILREAVTKGCVWMDDWIKEVEAEEIRNNKLYRWLDHHQNYEQPKDREYAAYVKGLMKTWEDFIGGTRGD